MSAQVFDCTDFAPNKPIRWDVFNRITGKTTSYKSGPAATRACDRMDNAYGAYICSRRAVWSEG